MKTRRQTITIASEEHFQVIDLTKQIRDMVSTVEVTDGIVLANPLHTTCTLLVGEPDGALAEDLKTTMERLVVDRAQYKHNDSRYSDCERGNACSHLRAALLGRTIALGIGGGELSLGPNQSILLVELDGPRRRDIEIQILGV